MSGRADSDTPAAISPAPMSSTGGTEVAHGARGAREAPEDHGWAEGGCPEGVSVARRARWTAAGTGVLLTLAGLAASLLRLTDAAPARVPAAYAAGAVVCACAAALGQRGRTRRALWLLVAGVMMMALGDQPG
ncbi:hypothetical protein [Streptomyces sp. NPDC056160]|uniref:hypothetical protein n=1 Tax=Streptomyces sp. NPDC056160 TaxID=3345731 RepID=UPI0035D67E13